MQIIKQAEKKTYARDEELSSTVANIISDVATRGDAVLIELAEKFDKVKIDHVKVTEEQVKQAYELVAEDVVETIRFAADQITYFAEKQLETMSDLDIAAKVPGLRLGHRMLPVERVGAYIPAGRHPLPSSALMNVCVAKVAGVKHVAACSPAFKGYDTIHPAVLVAMDIAGADEIFCMGGAQAIAAFAYGTESVNKVDLIVGPGNRFVTEAKRQVLGDVGIDSLAGPSEVLIIADETANPTFVAIDLLGQAEHDPDAKAILVSTDKDLIDEALVELERLLDTLSTVETARTAWENNGSVYLVDSIDEAIDLSNQIAPEHLEVQVKNEEEVAERLENYGSLFVGHYAPVSFGDFVSGTNHTLPTMGTARYSSGLWVGTFIKHGFFQFISAEACLNMSDHCMTFANLEGLQAHSDAVRLRVEHLEKEKSE